MNKRAVSTLIACLLVLTGCENRDTRQQVCNSMATIIEAAAALGQGAEPAACLPVINTNANAVIRIHGGRPYQSSTETAP